MWGDASLVPPGQRTQGKSCSVLIRFPNHATALALAPYASPHSLGHEYFSSAEKREVPHLGGEGSWQRRPFLPPADVREVV